MEKGGMAVVIGMGGGREMGEVEFQAPEGFDYSDMKEGEEKEVLAKVRYDGEGEFKLVSVDGYPLGQTEEEEIPEMEEEGVEEASPFQEQLRQRAGLA